MPWTNTEISRKPRAALLADLCMDTLLPLSKEPPPAERVASAVRGLDILQPAGDPAVVADTLLAARAGVINWLRSYSMRADGVDKLLHSVLSAKQRMSLEDEPL